MKLYTVNQTYYGTQAEAKTAAKEAGLLFDPEGMQVEVPTDKPGLIAYLNELVRDSGVEDEFTVIVERQDPEVSGEGTVVSHAERAVDLAMLKSTVDLDSAFQAAPLGQQLTLAAIAMENARSRIGRENAPKPAPQGYAGKVERAAPEPDPLDDLLG